MKTIQSPHSFLFLHINAVLNMSTLFPKIVIVYLSPHRYYCKFYFLGRLWVHKIRTLGTFT